MWDLSFCLDVVCAEGRPSVGNGQMVGQRLGTDSTNSFAFRYSSFVASLAAMTGIHSMTCMRVMHKGGQGKADVLHDVRKFGVG